MVWFFLAAFVSPNQMAAKTGLFVLRGQWSRTKCCIIRQTYRTHMPLLSIYKALSCFMESHGIHRARVHTAISKEQNPQVLAAHPRHKYHYATALSWLGFICAYINWNLQFSLRIDTLPDTNYCMSKLLVVSDHTALLVVAIGHKWACSVFISVMIYEGWVDRLGGSLYTKMVYLSAGI